MSEHLVVVTGGSAGLGRALLTAAPAGARRVNVSRRGTEMQGVEEVPADLSDPARWPEVGRAIADEVAAQAWDRITVVHAASTLDPIGFAGEVETAAYTRNVLLNSAAPQVLGHTWLGLLHDLPGRRELVLMTSGAATTAYQGWSGYGAGKAATDHWVRCVGAEQADRSGVQVLSVAPGVVATAMQETIRATDPADFPHVERFQRLHDEGQLADPTDVARRLWQLLDDRSVATGSVIDLRRYG